MPAEIVEVVITAPDAEWLAGFTHTLVEERLCACGQMVPAIRSIYRWQGEIHDEPEARVALHTRSTLVPRILERVRDEHPYEVPCVIVLPIQDGSAAYLDWVRAETNAG